jgi:hypothetical protein
MLESLQMMVAPHIYAVGVTLAVVLLVMGLLLIMPRVVAVLLRRLAPSWIDRTTKVIQVVVLLGGLVLITGWLDGRALVALLTMLLLGLVAATLHPGNVISDGLATVRIRTSGYYRAGDSVTVANGKCGVVVAVTSFSTRLRLPTQEYLVVSNSSVVRSPILVHANPDREAAAPVAYTLHDAHPHERHKTAFSAAGEVEPASAGGQPPMSAPHTGAALAITATTASVDHLPIVLAAQMPLRKVAPLQRRPKLGKKTLRKLL